MKPAYQFALAALAAVFLAVLDLLFRIDAGLFLLWIAALSASGAVYGQRLPLGLRAFSTLQILYWGCQVCLWGRTMAPGISLDTTVWALGGFFVLALPPTLTLLRLWRSPAGLALVIAALPISLILAFTVADLEERAFVQRYKETSTNARPRWTVPDHWLAYDKERQRLYGFD